ncbi:MAG: hypothetical protein ACK45H_01255 [Bacteroidota bacterium]
MFSCSEKSRSELILGIWRLQTIKFLDNDEVRSFESDSTIILEIRNSSLSYREVHSKGRAERFDYTLKEDSIFLLRDFKQRLNGRIIQLDEQTLEFEDRVFRPARQCFVRIK